MTTERPAVLLAGAPSSGRRTMQAALGGRAEALDLRILGADGCDESFLRRVTIGLFVVDPRRARFRANERALESVREALTGVGRAREEVPLLFVLNKLDLPLDASGARMFAQFTGEQAPAPQLIRAPVAVLRRHFAWPHCDFAETIAAEGIGVDDALTRALALCRS